MTDLALLLNRAALLLTQGRIADAEAAARTVLSQEPYSDEALSILGRCAYERWAYQEGMAFIQEALSLQPQQSFYYYLLAFGLYQTGDLESAIDHVEMAQSQHPGVAEYYGLHAFILLRQETWAAALEKADEGLALDAANLTCLNARARALNKLKRPIEAIATMEQALAADPHDELTHTTIGWNYLEVGAHKQAQHHFREGLRLNPNSEGARAGIKEALKANLAPYRWLLQYHFWLQGKGRQWRVALPLGLYLLFRGVVAVMGAANAGAEWLLLPLGLYLFLVVTSWTIGPLANFVLLFHPLGKHALQASEKWTATTVVAALAGGLALTGIAFLPALASGGSLFIGGLILITLALPLSALEYPLRWRGQSLAARVPLLLVLTGLLAFAALWLLPGSLVLPLVYAVAFIAYNWSGLFR